jgi:ERCC4-type nuclease
MTSLQVDTNAAEDFIALHCTANGIVVDRRRLDVGDIAILTESSSFVIERKSWSDFQASICDGRWEEQKKRMLQGDTGSRFAYIIEGNVPPWESGAMRMQTASLWGALVKTQVRDGIFVFHTADKESTSKFIQYLYKQISTGGFAPKPVDNVVAGVNKRKRDNLSEPRDVMIAMLTILPGMSKGKAEAVVKVYPTWKELLGADRGRIAEITVGEGARRLGPALAKRITALA